MANIRERNRVPVPHVSLSALRGALGLTLEQVCTRFEAETGVPLTRGGLSAIETGIRGVSTATLAGLEAAYGLNQGEITTAYEPKTRERKGHAA